MFGVGCAAVGRRHQGFRRQEGGGNADGTVEQAAGVVAQVEYEPLERTIPEQLVEVLDHRRTRVLLERGDAQVAVAILDQFRLDALHLDHFARQGDVDRFCLPLADDRQSDLRLRLAAHALDGVGQRQPLDERVVDLEDEVAGLDSRPVGRRVLDRRDDLDQTVFHADLDTDAAELALRSYLQVLERVGIKVARVGVEVREHAADGMGDQLLVFDRLDIAALDRVEHFGKGAQFLDGQAGSRFLVRDRRKLQADQYAAQQSGADQPGLSQLAHLSHSRAHHSVCVINLASVLRVDPGQRIEWPALVAKLEV